MKKRTELTRNRIGGKVLMAVLALAMVVCGTVTPAVTVRAFDESEWCPTCRRLLTDGCICEEYGLGKGGDSSDTVPADNLVQCSICKELVENCTCSEEMKTACPGGCGFVIAFCHCPGSKWLNTCIGCRNQKEDCTCEKCEKCRRSIFECICGQSAINDGVVREERPSADAGKDKRSCIYCHLAMYNCTCENGGFPATEAKYCDVCFQLIYPILECNCGSLDSGNNGSGSGNSEPVIETCDTCGKPYSECTGHGCITTDGLEYCTLCFPPYGCWHEIGDHLCTVDCPKCGKTHSGRCESAETGTGSSDNSTISEDLGRTEGHDCNAAL